nr:P63C domain-containing protein [Dysgonomonas sp. 25]
MQLPKNVLEELESRTPKSEQGNYTARFFQSLTPDIGHPALTAQIYKVIGIMNISGNWAEFKRNFNKMVDRNNGQQELNFEEIEEEVEKIEKTTSPKPIQGILFVEEQSNFDKSLKQALDYNLKDEKPN